MGVKFRLFSMCIQLLYLLFFSKENCFISSYLIHLYLVEKMLPILSFVKIYFWSKKSHLEKIYSFPRYKEYYNLLDFLNSSLK